MNKNNIRERFLHMRKYYKLNQTDFSAEIGMSQSNFSKIESGKVKPSKTVLYALKSRFGINPNWLMTGKGDMFITSEEYIAEGIKLLGAEKFGEGLNNILKDPRFPELRSAVIFSEVVKDNLDQDLAAYLQYMIKLSQHKDERKRNWLMVQLERAFPEVGEKGEKYER